MDNNIEKAVEASASDLYAVRRRLEKEIPNGREKSLSLTKIDEAAMWIKQIPVRIG